MKIQEHFHLQEQDLSGSEIVARLRKGHAVRRAAWVDGLYCRICNDDHYDDDGNVIVDDRKSLYTYGTHGRFLHIGVNNQFLRDPIVYRSYAHDMQVYGREGEGMNAFFCDDWEDYGVMSNDYYQEITNLYNTEVNDEIQRVRDEAIARYKQENGIE